jgi:cholesterol oxidase
MVCDGEHEAAIFGTLHCPKYSARPLTVTNGRFNLFAHDDDRVETRSMRYRFFCWDPDRATRYYLVGQKVICSTSAMTAVWHAVTRLPFKLYEVPLDWTNEDSPRSPIDPGPDREVADGELRMGWRDALSLLLHARVTNENSLGRQIFGLARFAAFYGMTLFRQAAWILLRPTDVTSAFTPPRAHSCREGGAQEGPVPKAVISVMTEDHVDIRLSRYYERGASLPGVGDAAASDCRKGPVLLAPGFGTSTFAFTLPTVETNLTEFLTRAGYDVWLLDYRASEHSYASGTSFTLDEIARYDFPAAVQKVLEVRRREERAAGARQLTESVQVLGHCVGSGALFMSLLGGHLKNVRSLIFSQMFTHMDQPLLNRAKAHLRIGDFVRFIGAWPTINPDFDTRSPWVHQVLDRILRFYPTSERCRNPVCRRILLLYGPVNRHAELNAPTHDAMHEMFNRANLGTFRHLSRQIRKGRLVDRTGRDKYLELLPAHAKKRLRIPITLMQGERNGIFRPRGLEWSRRWLVRAGTNSGLAEELRPIGLDLEDPKREGRGLVAPLWIDDPTPWDGRRPRDRYGHMDCFIGRNASLHVFPKIQEELERGDQVARRLAVASGRGATGDASTIPSLL